MAVGILLTGIVVLCCVFLNKLTQKAGIPMLLAFIILGLLFGTDGILKIPFENYKFAEDICSVALIFIMFYGGFGTNWNAAKVVAPQALLLATAGVATTGILTGLFCNYILHIPFWESMLIGAVISSTDAATVFSILRSKKLGLKDGTDSMLEVESGSNDPSSYMLTIIVLSVLKSGISFSFAVKLLISQFVFGLLAGVAIAYCAIYIFRHFKFETAGFDMAFVLGIALLSYALAAVFGGNGYLSTYVCGIIFGNQKLINKKALVHFFDGVTGLMQMLIFFLLGLLATPSRIPQIFIPALIIMLMLTLVARPIAVFSILSLFKSPIKQQLLVSFAGLRGAASIVFAIMAVVQFPNLNYDIYHIIFCIVLLSITVQGTFLPLCARLLKMTDQSIDVMKTFNDYTETAELQFIKIRITENHQWVGKEIRSIGLMPETLIILIMRDGENLVPGGSTIIQENDIAVLSAYKYNGGDELSLIEYVIEPNSKWVGQTVRDFSPEVGELVIMIIRNNHALIPKGNTIIEENDTLVVNS